MVINRGGRKVVTVDIVYDNYVKAKAKAVEKNMKIRQVVNNILQEAFEKEEFISRVAPFLSIDSYADNRITVKDVNEKVLVDVFYRDGDLWSDQDKSVNCKHTKFVWMAPSIAKMLPHINGKKNRNLITV